MRQPLLFDFSIQSENTSLSKLIINFILTLNTPAPIITFAIIKKRVFNGPAGLQKS